MSFKHINSKAQKYERRQEKQRDYQADYRERMKRKKVPERDQIGDGLLIAIAGDIAVTGKISPQICRALSHMLDNLCDRGFDREEAWQAFRRLVKRLKD